MPRPGPHAMLAETTHDEAARMGFVFCFKEHVTKNVLPGNASVYETRVKPAFTRAHNRPPKDRHEVHKEMRRDPYWQMWGSLMRLTQELKHTVTEPLVHRQAGELNGKARAIRETAKKSTLRLDPALKVPRYLSAVDIHLLPGSYFTERTEDDVSAGAMYDPGVYLFAMGRMGRYNESMGASVVHWLEEQQSGFRPRKILDMGCAVGHSTIPYLDAFPGAEVYAIDVAAPVLRYAQARAESMGYGIGFSQQNAEHTDFEDESFDLIVSHILLHETSRRAVYNIMKEAHRLLRPGGLVLHAEAPVRNKQLDPFTAFMRDWSTHYNAEPFWGTLHDMDLVEPAVEAGFAPEEVIDIDVPMINYGELIGAGAYWMIYGARKGDVGV